MLIKWPGGKDQEYNLVKPFIPVFDTYVEPFFGSGAIFFNMKPHRSLLNDINDKLMRIYMLVQSRSSEFEETINAYVTFWEKMDEVTQLLQPSLLELYDTIRDEPMSSLQLKQLVSNSANVHKAIACDYLQGFFGDVSLLWATIIASLQSKWVRLPKLERDNNVRFDRLLMMSHLETAVRGGFYTYLRDVHIAKSAVEDAVVFYFLREFCYGSMFRFNKDGKFNIPYGGIAYNRKNFRAKAARLFSEETRQHFQHAQLTALDFRTFFKRHWDILSPDTFCFLDPPYDTEFSAYDNMSFTMDDQRALSRLFAKLPCKSMLIVKDTESILNLYREARCENSNIQIARYDKTYTYNTRGRNIRDVQHLVICNYKLMDPNLFPECNPLELL